MATSARLPQPGDGAYLSPPQPGQGNYLTSNAGASSSSRGYRGGAPARRGFQGSRGGPIPRGGSARRTQSIHGIPPPPDNRNNGPTVYDHGPNGYDNGPNGYDHRPSRGHPHRPQSIDARHAPMAPPNFPPSARYRNSDAHHHDEPARNGPNGSAFPHDVRSVVQPRTEAAERAAPPHMRSNLPPKGASDDAPPPAGPRAGGRERGGRPLRGRGRGAGPSAERSRERPAQLNVAAPAFEPQTASDLLASITMTKNNEPAHAPTASSSRAPSREGRSRSDRGGKRSQPKEGRREKETAASEKVNGGPEPESDLVTEPLVPDSAESSGEPPKTPPTATRSSRRAAFAQQSKLTTAGDREALSKAKLANDGGQKDVAEPVPAPRRKKEEKDDLISRLTRGLGKRPFVECPICFNSINPSQAIYCCLPPTEPAPANIDDDAPTNYYQACYTPFHLSCIRDWADRSLAEESERIRTNQLLENDGKVKRPEWRCPGCQKRRVGRVGQYKCFCGRNTNPPTNTLLPHSCAEQCSRPRPLCSHPCSLPCHPGPCPPCQVALVVPCPSHHSSLTVKCAAATAGANMTPVCDEVCGRLRGCGDRSHTCQLLCHFGPCAPCTETETVKCYCGAESREETCGWKKDDEMQCARAPESGVEEHWLGRWGCGRECGEVFDCGIHTCEETCHPHPLHPLPCPTSPSQILTCPCGQTLLESLCEPNGLAPPRVACTDPVPTCSLPCPESRPCGHQCPLTCHHGECPPCHQDVVRPCRCGESVFTVRCEEFGQRIRRGEGEMTCERVCKALRNCGRHECSRVCCPLSYKAKSSRMKKKPGDTLQDLMVAPGEEDLHTCSLTCGKWLSCGLHTCQRKDHRGACGRCLQASYEELICHCGETIIYPPVACGTTIRCSFTCARPPPSCGHPKTSHACHESPNCPPCPYLTTRPCACSKDPAVKNIRCSQSIVSCGQTCGNLLGCGFHRCDKTCHKQGEGECGECSQVCGKPKRVCRHPCTSACHAPAKCPESDPCGAIVDQKCACGNLSVRTTCGANASGTGTKGESRELVQLKCNSECLVKQRNARLAEALGIKGAEGRAGGAETAEWSAELKAFAQGNWAFVRTVETALADFYKSGKPSHILPQMPASKRTFVLSLAQIYRLSTDLLDAEPNRSIMIRRRVETRIPNPLLSAVVTPPVATEKKTGLTNLRASTPVAASPSGATWGKILAPTPSSSPWGSASGASTPAINMASRAVSPAIKASRPTTPAVQASSSSTASTTMTVPVNQTSALSGPGLGLARKNSARQDVVGEVGKVEEDDWDVDA